MVKWKIRCHDMHIETLMGYTTRAWLQVSLIALCLPIHVNSHGYGQYFECAQNIYMILMFLSERGRSWVNYIIFSFFL